MPVFKKNTFLVHIRLYLSDAILTLYSTQSRPLDISVFPGGDGMNFLVEQLMT